jgi:glycosyltransferase involved in cell wall biosynthesis
VLHVALLPWTDYREEALMLSVVMATRNKAPYLARTLKSIVEQYTSFPVETIVVDDGSTDETPEVCRQFGVRYHRIDRPYTGNNGIPFNLGYRMAQGEIVLTTSDEVEHRTPELMEALVVRLTPTTFVSPKVVNVDPDGKPLDIYCGPGIRAQLLCSAVWRADLYAVGGHDEDFAKVGSNDTFLLRCLAKLPRQFVGCWDLEAWHYDHPKPPRDTQWPLIYKTREAEAGTHPWTARAGAWEMPA